MSKAQQNQKYIAKLKASSKYDEHKQKRANKMREYRKKKAEEKDETPLAVRAIDDAKRRENQRERIRKFRERKRNATNQNLDDETASNFSHSNASQCSSLSDLSSVGYNTVQSLGKAVNKAKKALPQSPMKQRAVLANIVSNMNEQEKSVLANAIISPPPKTKHVSKWIILKKAIIEFYQRDDVSRASPKIRDVKEYVCPETGENILLPTKHMELTIREANGLFNHEQSKAGKGVDFFSIFC